MYYRDPQHSTAVNQAELDYIKAGGGYGSENQSSVSAKISWQNIKFFLSKNDLGFVHHPVCLLVYALFFPDWFIVYPEKGLHLSISKAGIGAMLPYIMAMLGVLCGGTLSDMLLKKENPERWHENYPLWLACALP